MANQFSAYTQEDPEAAARRKAAAAKIGSNNDWLGPVLGVLSGAGTLAATGDPSLAMQAGKLGSSVGGTLQTVGRKDGVPAPQVDSSQFQKAWEAYQKRKEKEEGFKAPVEL